VTVEANAPQVVVTVAVNWAVPPGATLTVAGFSAMERILSETVIVVTALFVVSATLVATTW
jgi:hypothetical protein